MVRKCGTRGFRRTVRWRPLAMALSDCLLARCRQTLLALGAVLAIAGCALQGPQTSADARTSEPGAGPARTGPDHAGLRRCLDILLIGYGMRDVSVIVDELADSSQRDGVGTREMLIAAVSDMTQRSRAIRLVASDNDRKLARSQSPQAGSGFAEMAQYALRGTLHAQAGDPAGSASTTVLALDLALLTTQNMSVVPGTASRNVATLIAPSPGREGRVELHKFGVDFSLPTSGGSAREGRAVATRALLDVAAIEIFGRVAKLPYWSCFGAGADQAPVAAEIQDWYDTMAVHPAELIGYFQQQLRARGLYDGPLDGNVNPSLKNAVVRYRAALGLSREPKLSLEFF